MSTMPYTPTPPSADSDKALLRRARHRVSAHLGFGIRLLAFPVVNARLAAITLSHEQLWPVWSLLDWGLGLVAHGLGLAWSQGNGYQRMVDQELTCLRKQADRR